MSGESKSRKELINALKDNGKRDWTENDVRRALMFGIRDLHSSVTPMLVFTLLYGLTVVTQIFVAPLIDIPTADWYLNFISYEVILPPAFGILLFGYMIYSYLHNMQRRAQNIFFALVGFWTILLFALWVWIWIEMFWYCPTHTPIYCTDGITSGLDTGYLVFAIATLIQWPILVITLIYYNGKLGMWRAIYTASKYDARALGPLIIKNMAYKHSYTVAIGQQIGDEPKTGQSFRSVVNDMLEEAKQKYDAKFKARSDAYTKGVTDLHAFVLPIIVVSLLYALTLLVQVFALPLIPMKQSQWYSIPATFEFVIPPAIGTLAFGYIIYAYGNNMKRWAYAIHGILIGILWVVPLTLLVAWFMIEYWWYCPNNTPFYCTNGMTDELALGYQIFVWVTLIQMVILWIEVALFAVAARMWRRLYTLTAFQLVELDDMLYNEPQYQSYLVTIGQKKE